MSPETFSKKEIVLRDGRDAILWVDSETGHGILDPAFWVPEDFYEEEYRRQFSAKSDGEETSPEHHLEIYQKLNNKQFNHFKKLLSDESKVLEIGASFGGILRLVQQSGVSDCHAIEPNLQDADFLRRSITGIEVFQDTFENAPLENSFYDLIICFEVLEHVADPGRFVSRLSEILKPGGAVNFEVPNHRAALFECYQKTNHDRFYYHKAHIHYFTSESLALLFAEHGIDGQSKSFATYPFFNHVFWHFNKGPQASAEIAFTTPQPAHGNHPSVEPINKFYEKAEAEYEELLNSTGGGDCLVFQGRKKTSD